MWIIKSIHILKKENNLEIVSIKIDSDDIA